MTDKRHTILFFGSTTDSVVVLEKLHSLSGFTVSAVVTQQPKPIGRSQLVTPTPVETWAKDHAIAVLSFPANKDKPWLFADEQQVIDTLQPVGADVLISASYGIKIPWATIKAAPLGGINVHPSILPKWRGADPVPWAIMSGDHQAGVTIVTLSESFDEGTILAQEKIPITPRDTSDPLRTKLFTVGAELLGNMLPDYVLGKIDGKTVHYDKALPYARKFKREDGFEQWGNIVAAVETGLDAERIERKFRALHPWPGIWTNITRVNRGTAPDTAEKRLKILGLRTDNGKLVIERVQLEGKNPVTWEQFNRAYIAP